MIYLKLFFEFFKTGLFAVGGGLATIPFLQEMSAKTGWFTINELADMIAIAESTPGPLGINTATYVGFTTTGVLGSITATLGIIAPALIICIIIANVLQKFQSNPIVQNVFSSLRPASVALIAAAGMEVVKLSILTLDAYQASGNILDICNFKALLLACVIFVLTKVFKKLHPIVFICIGALCGILFNFA